ncbi:PREDICTED: cathepsin B-like [Amphimedon queenslandica]|uniref:Peptidase C1A papain C-terminal domain-containing protein n=1 Tax=Amphimedon queenslandica TaxID=400682 RepID=A0A1X7U7D2_AMPQE|nr:PREDICTED: cathepsin B-like [Amphimedon queenslandica]|eukprot:XP_003388842.1 PREDICTED: cathepsin B-like [Amphimedon queenslandica]
MSFYKCLLVLFAVASIASAKPLDFQALSDDVIDYVNSLNTTWTAARSPRFPSGNEVDVKDLCGVLDVKHTLPYKEKVSVGAIPDTFDARQKWSDCPSISDIRDQGSCGSCWALGAVEAMSDRYCVSFQENVHISAENLMTCCKFCGNGCAGGFLQQAWEYWVKDGLVTGGQYGSDEGCQPYLIPKCNHHEPGPYENCTGEGKTPQCERTCRSGYTTSYEADLHYGEKAYAVHREVEAIQTEIMTNGPVEGAFTVYSDFPTYKSGVYQHVVGHALGGHAIRILGWGTENGVPYWLIANSWNPSWGDKGYFKMIRGKDDCGIESNIVAGTPKKYK